MLLLMISNGLLVTLLTVRATAYGFTQTEIAFMQAAYPLAALFGCAVTPQIVARVGHIRSFGALASLCSTAALIHMVTADRSEEHTSELQSLMRISYAVFCLKKKKTQTQLSNQRLMTPS